MKDWDFKPAADLGLNPAERWRSIDREPGLLSHLAHKTANALINLYLRVMHRMQIHGAARIPRKGPFIVVANHSSHLDVLALAEMLPREIREEAFPIAAGDVFFETPARSMLSAIFLNALPMWRKHCGSHAIKDLRDRLLHEPIIYLLFPEGTRARDGVMRPFKSGVGMLVAETDIPVVPCYLSGCFEAMPADARFPRPVDIHVWVGMPRTFKEVENGREGWAKIATDLQHDIAGLLHDAQSRQKRK